MSTMKACLYLITALLLVHVAFSQSPATDTLNNPQYKNSVKGSFYVVPPIFFITGVSLGYERHISKHGTLGISSFYFLFFDEMGLYHNVGLFPAY